MARQGAGAKGSANLTRAEARAREKQEAQAFREWLKAAKETHAQLESVAAGLYDEVDKLTRKWPSMPVSQLTLEKTNRLIRAVKALMKDEADTVLEDLTEFVPAGDLPENRDVVLTLREVKDLLDRFEQRYQDEWDE